VLDDLSATVVTRSSFRKERFDISTVKRNTTSKGWQSTWFACHYRAGTQSKLTFKHTETGTKSVPLSTSDKLRAVREAKQENTAPAVAHCRQPDFNKSIGEREGMENLPVQYPFHQTISL
jgi:hypothetical protein